MAITLKFAPLSIYKFIDAFLPIDFECPPLPEVDCKQFAALADLEGDEMHDALIAALQPFCCNGLKLVNVSSSFPAPAPTDDAGPSSSSSFNDRNDEKTNPASPKYFTPIIEGYAAHDSASLLASLLSSRPKSNPTPTPFSEIAVFRYADDPNVLDTNTSLPTHSFGFILTGRILTLIYCTPAQIITTKTNFAKHADVFATFFWRLSHASARVRGDARVRRWCQGEDERGWKGGSGRNLEVRDVVRHDPVIEFVGEGVRDGPERVMYAMRRRRVGRRCIYAREVMLGRRMVHLEEVGHPEALVDMRKALGYGLGGDQCVGAAISCGIERENTRGRAGHYRMPLSIGVPLQLSESTWQVVSAVKCALRGCCDASDKGFLHFDILFQNIFIQGKDGGFLVDWDMSHYPRSRRTSQASTQANPNASPVLSFTSVLQHISFFLNFGPASSSEAVRFMRNISKEEADAQQERRCIEKRKRYERIGRVVNAPAYVKMQGVVREGVERMKEGVKERVGGGNEGEGEKESGENESVEMIDSKWLYGVLDEALRDEEWRIMGGSSP